MGVDRVQTGRKDFVLNSTLVPLGQVGREIRYDADVACWDFDPTGHFLIVADFFGFLLDDVEFKRVRIGPITAGAKYLAKNSFVLSSIFTRQVSVNHVFAIRQ